MNCPCGKTLNPSVCLWVDDKPTGYCDAECYRREHGEDPPDDGYVDLDPGWDADDGGPGQDYNSAFQDLCDPW